MKCLRRAIGLLLLALFLAACSWGNRGAQPLRGRILLWHMWNEADAAALDRLLARFHEVYPGIKVITIAYTPDQLQEQFRVTVDRGLGPDLLIAPHLWTPELADADLIRPLDEDSLDLSMMNPKALATLRYQDRLYGAPLAVQTSALYYNRDLVETPPATLDALLEQAESGAGVAINTDFAAAFWGVQAFGGRLLDEEGRVVLNQGGFANWLGWLQEANGAPNVILNNEEELMRALFAEGKVAYYVGRSSELSSLRQLLGSEVVGVAPLPAGPNDAAGPFLSTEAFFFSTASSPAQAERAALLVQFLTNAEQQRKLARETGRIPANAQVRIDRRIVPAVASFLEQTKTAIPLTLAPQMFETIRRGRDVYVQVLEGLIAPEDAALALTEEVNQKLGLETLAAAAEVTCQAVGVVELWHSWPDWRAAALAHIAERYQETCPGLTLHLQAFSSDELLAQYWQAAQEGQGPDLLLTSSQEVQQLASAGLIQDLSAQVSPTFLQRYIPAAPATVRVGNGLYALPVTLETFALYYNAYLMSDPPADLGDLLAQIGPDRSFLQPLTPFEALHWGASAFGGRVYDASGALVLTSGGTAEWLSWLQEAQAHPGFLLTRDQAEATQLFLRGQAAMMVGSSEQLPILEQELGRTGVGVAPLPAGPEGPAGPLLMSQALMLNTNALNSDAAMEFARYLTDIESQTVLVKEARAIPANNNLVLDETEPGIAGLRAQTNTALSLPNRAESDTLLALGPVIYDKVLVQKGEPAEVLADFTTFVARMHAPETTSPCTEEGEVILWHGLLGAEAQALEQIVADFVRVCPEVQIQVVYVPIEELPNRLAQAVQGAQAQDQDANQAESADVSPPPDLFVTTHDLTAPLSDERLIQPVAELVDGATLVPFMSEALAAFQVQDTLYGLPLSLETTTLYYNPELTPAPPSDLYDLFASATLSTPLALDVSFRHAFWGAVAFGGNLAGVRSQPEETNAAGINLGQTELVRWLDWLQAIQSRPGILLSQDATRLKELFVTGKTAFLIASTGLLAPLRAELEAESPRGARVGVASLPPGPNGAASPFLRFDGFLFTAGGEERSRRAAVRFATFAVSGPEQALFIQEANRLPANIMAQTLVEDPAMPNIIAQVRTGVRIPPWPQAQLLFQGGDELYRAVLEDGAAPSVAMQTFTDYLAQTPPPPLVVRAGETVAACAGAGRVLFWHPWPALAETTEAEAASTAFWEQVNAVFQKVCPDTVLETLYVPPEDLDAALAQAQTEGGRPDLFVVEHSRVPPLVQSGLITPVTGLLDESRLGWYAPSELDAFRYEGALYGLPAFLDVAGLFYNTDLVTTTVTTLDELLAAASEEHPVLLPLNFRDLYWGVEAFGPAPFDRDAGLLDVGGLEAWLHWLQTAQAQPGFVLREDGRSLERLFARGEGAYLVAHVSALPRLRQFLGERVRAIPLPDGPNGPARPLMTVEGLVLTRSEEPEQVQRVATFAQVLTDISTLNLLTALEPKVPANRRVAETLTDPALAAFATVALEQGTLLPAGISPAQVQLLDDLFRQVVAGEVEPSQAMEALHAAFSQE